MRISAGLVITLAAIAAAGVCAIRLLSPQCVGNNEPSAWAALGIIAGAQRQFHAAAGVDLDRDGRGEFGTLAEMSGAVALAGHDAVIQDVLLTQDGFCIFDTPRIYTRATHGTGCTLASAIAAYMALYELIRKPGRLQNRLTCSTFSPLFRKAAAGSSEIFDEYCQPVRQRLPLSGHGCHKALHQKLPPRLLFSIRLIR